MTVIAASLRNRTSTADGADDVQRLRVALAEITEGFRRFSETDPAVLVQPFEGRVELAVDNVDSVTDWYAPAAVVLMLQQFGVAFGALAFVRERQLGIVDVLRVAPVNATESLLGKYLAYLALGGGIGAGLTALLVGVLGVPLASSVGAVAVVMTLSLFARL